MRFGDNIVEVVRQRLHWCNAFVPVISRDNYQRPWLVFEINTAIIRSFERECVVLPVLCDIGDEYLSADLRQFKSVAVDASDDYVSQLKTRLLDDVPTADERRWDLFRPLPQDFDLPALLSWRVRSSALHGRTQEFEELLNWADDEQPGARVRIVSGPGGAGKTRLAAELAIQLWKSGWDTQFIHTVDGVPATRGVASLWIIDYPEEQQELTKFFRQIRQFQRAHRVRILMLTRQPREWWLKHSALRTAHAGDLLGETFDLEFEALSADDTVRLYREVTDTVGHWFDKTIPEITDADLLEWRLAAPEHRLPLYITALALRMVSSDATKLDMSGREVMRELVWRERGRVDAYGSQDPDNPEEWPSRALGLAALTECLNGSTLRRLADERLEMGMPRKSVVVDRVRQTPLWNDEQHGVLPLRPDIFAATFFHEVLSAREDIAPEWVWATIETEISGDAASVRDRIGRLIFDIQKICNAGEPNLALWMTQLVKADPTRAMKLRDFAADERPPEFLLPLLVEINTAVLSGGALTTDEQVATLRILGYQLALLQRDKEARRVFKDAVDLCESTNNEAELAAVLRGLSGVIEDSDTTAKVAAAVRALDILRKLAADQDITQRVSLARALNNYALAVDDPSRAIAALEEGAAICTQILKEVEPDEKHVHEDSLARALFNLANERGRAGQYDSAIENSRESVEIRRRLYAEYRWRYARYFAMSLSQLAQLSQAKGKGKPGIAEAAIRETVEIYTHLYKANPAQFGVDLVRAMGLRSSVAYADGDKDRAIMLRQEQAVFVAKVLSEGRIGRYSDVLREITLHLITDGYNAASSNANLALDVCTQAIDILKIFKVSEKQLWDQEMHYALVGGYLNRGNARKSKSSQEAIADYGMGVDEADQLRATHGFVPRGAVAKELCLLNRCIERLRSEKVEAAISDVHAAIECEEDIRRELGDEWPLADHREVLRSLSVLRDHATLLTTKDVARLLVLEVSIARGLLAGGKQSPIETVRTLLSLGRNSIATNRKLATRTLQDAVEIMKEIDDDSLADLQAAASFYNDTAYMLGLMIEGLDDFEHIPFAADIARRAVAIATDPEQRVWGDARETLGFVSGLLLRVNSSSDTMDESQSAFREAIAFFRQRNSETQVQVSIADWEKVHGPYAEDVV